ncbi:MAG: gliding motility protein GldN [Flavobacteriales bacterium]|nr:gliding motility protein GldN [Flavobacteriales bacterium]
MERSAMIIVAVCLTGQSLVGQNVLDGAYIKEHTPTRRVIPDAQVREADVLSARRIWSEIDMREKINMPLFYPLEASNGRQSLFHVIRDAVLNGELNAFDAGPFLDEDDFGRILAKDELEAILEPTSMVLTDRLDGSGAQDAVEVPMPLTSASITKYRIKEDRVFDKQRGVMEHRLIGIAPMREVRGEDGELRGYAPVFWLYFPELRFLLANVEAFNRWNDGERRSLEHVLDQHLFTAYVVKVSNVHDRRIGDTKDGVDALLEGEEVEEALFRFEHDLWNP